MNRPLFRRLFAPPVAEQLDQEIALHRDLLIADLVARGVSPDDAQRQAAHRLGDLAVSRAEALAIGQRREQQLRRSRVIDHFLQDIRFALRSLRRQKGWTAVALLTFALGIGACTAVFSVVDSLLLHPLPYPNAGRVVLMYEALSDLDVTQQVTISPFVEALQVWRTQAHSFEAIEPYTSTDMTRLDQGTPSLVRATAITPTFLRFAGLQPLLGRNFLPSDSLHGGPKVVMLGETIWRRDFGSDRGVLGRSIVLDGSPYAIVGVMPRALQVAGPGPTTPDIWLPLAAEPQASLPTLGRLAPGATFANAERELDTLAARAELTTAKEFKAYLARPADTVNFRSSLVLLSGAVAIVLLIACANVAHLLLARGAGREREFALRAALGAGRGRLLRQLITESLALALGGCALGLGLGWVALRVLVAARPDGLAELAGAKTNWLVVAAIAGAAVTTGLVFGVTTLLQASHKAPQASLTAGARSGGTRLQHRFRSLLVVSEMAMAAMLLVGATLLVRSMIHLQGTSAGFNDQGLYAVESLLPRNAPKRPELLEAFLAAARRIPGVADVTIAQNTPPTIAAMFATPEIEGKEQQKKEPFISYEEVHPGFFRFLGIPITAGTTFTDTTAGGGQVIISHGTQQHYWPGESAVGKRLRFSAASPWLTVVGVTADAALRGSTSDASAPMFYLPLADSGRGTVLIRMRGTANPVPALRALVASLDPHLAPPGIHSVADDMRRVLARPRFTMLLLTIFSLIAVALAAIGLYGVLAYSVTQRTREIGIRVALGATRGRVLRNVVASGIGLAAMGAVIGIGGAFWATRALESLLYGVPRTDPASFAASVVILLATAALACIVPARRAVSVDPMTAIRNE